MYFDSLKKISAYVKPSDISYIEITELIDTQIEIPDLPVIDLENTIIGDIK